MAVAEFLFFAAIMGLLCWAVEYDRLYPDVREID